MTPDQIKQLIEQGLPGATAEVTSPDGTHFQARVVHDDFSGRSTIERHRLVYDTLGERVGNEIHALQLVTLTSGERADA